MISVLVTRLRSLRLLRASRIVMRLRVFLLLIAYLKTLQSFRKRVMVIRKDAYLFVIIIQTEDCRPFLIVTGVETCNFLFSSRRRHTRSDRDWSSDVCSSD